MIHLILISFLILYCVVKFYVNKKYSYWKNHDVPFPTPWFIFGNVEKAFLRKEGMPDLFLRLYREYKDYSYVGFYNFLTPALVLRDPELINDVLIKNFDNFQDTKIRVADPIAGVNAFFVGGEQWKKLRKEMAPQISSNKIKYMYGRIENVCQQMIEHIKDENACVDLERLCYTFTGDNVMSCAYGLENKSFLNNLSLLIEVLNIFENTKTSSISNTIGFFFDNFSRIFNISYLGVQTPKLLTDIIDTGVNSRINSKTNQNDFIDFLVKLKISKDRTYLSHAVAFYIDGFETTAFAMIYLLFELACNTKVQETAAKEVFEVYKKHNTIYSSDAVKDLIYVEYAVYETLRKHPIIRYLNRKCTKDCIIPHPKNSSKTVFIKKGTQVFIPSEAIQKDPQFYTQPKDFDPSRFNNKHEVKKVFFGFGEGPRMCLGKNFALLQLKMGVASILLHFTIELNEKTKLPLGKRTVHLSKIPLNKTWLNFIPRH